MRYKMLLATTAMTAAAAAMAVSLAPPPAQAQSDDDAPMAAILAVEIATLREQYEARIRALEEQVRALQSGAAGEMADHHDHGHDDHGHDDHMDDDHADHDDHGHGEGMAEHDDHGAMLAPQVSAVLRGMFASYSAEESEIAGFPPFGHESERAPEGLSLGHSEIVLSSDISNMVRGNLTLGIGAHPGEPAELELEEAYIKTLPGLGLSENFSIAAGRKLWSFGYLNERHAHEDDFADRPLPYRAFLDNGFNDDGIQLSLALPGDVRTEIGGGFFRGDDQPFGGSDNGRRALSAYARIGGDMGRDSSWRIGASLLSGEIVGGAGGHAHGHGHEDEHDEHGHEDDHADDHDDHMDDHADDHDDEHEHEDDHADDHDDHMDDHDDDHADDHDDEHEDDHDDDHEMIPSSFFSDGVFSGDRTLFGTDFRFAWAPTGNARQSELIFQGEYLWQTDDGVYTLEDDEMEEHELATDGRSAGWYAQAVYKFAPEWRIGARYARLSPSSAAHVDHDPSALAIMGDWTSDRFGQLRLQYNRESLAHGAEDDQVVLQYTVSLGGHAGHDH